jgi:hypothetical protein
MDFGLRRRKRLNWSTGGISDIRGIGRFGSLRTIRSLRSIRYFGSSGALKGTGGGCQVIPRVSAGL